MRYEKIGTAYRGMGLLAIGGSDPGSHWPTMAIMRVPECVEYSAQVELNVHAIRFFSPRRHRAMSVSTVKSQKRSTGGSQQASEFNCVMERAEK